MLRVLRPDGRLLIGEFRPPSNSVGNRLIGAVAGPVMRHNRIQEFESMVADTGFTAITSGDPHPCIRYMTATKPAVAE